MNPRSLAARRSIVALLCAVGTLLGGPGRANSLDPPVLRNGISQFILLEPQALAPSTPLRGLKGTTTRSMASFRGKIVLLNFWASWCAPCAEEMPSLDALAESIPSDRFVVVAVSLDGDNGQAVRSFVARNHLQHLTVLLDPHHQFGALTTEETSPRTMPVYGLPTSYVLDRDGRVTGYLVGPTAWDSSEARSFINYFTNRK